MASIQKLISNDSRMNLLESSVAFLNVFANFQELGYFLCLQEFAAETHKRIRNGEVVLVRVSTTTREGVRR